MPDVPGALLPELHAGACKSDETLKGVGKPQTHSRGNVGAPQAGNHL